MKKPLYSLDVWGAQAEWEIRFRASPECVADLRAVGAVIYEVVNVIPQWWVDLGLPVRLWCWMQDRHIV